MANAPQDHLLVGKHVLELLDGLITECNGISRILLLASPVGSLFAELLC